MDDLVKFAERLVNWATANPVAAFFVISILGGVQGGFVKVLKSAGLTLDDQVQEAEEIRVRTKKAERNRGGHGPA